MVFFPKHEINEIIKYISPLKIFILHNSYYLNITRDKTISINFWKCQEDMGHSLINDHDYHIFLTMFTCFWGYWIKIKYNIIQLLETDYFS